jgi:RNA polymerase sigma factor (sigma-70 family)
MTPSGHGAADARTDADLVQDFLGGHTAALADLYDRFAPGLYDTAAAMLRDRDGASDVVQDVFCAAATKLGQLRDPTRVKPWLYAIARHEIFRRTKQRSRTTSLDALGDEFGMDPTASPDPHADGAVAESQELASLIRDAAYGLDPTDQLLRARRRDRRSRRQGALDDVPHA